MNAVAVSATEITCILGGGRTGTYQVVVIVDQVGASTSTSASNFDYKIVVNSVSTTSNSMGGGYEMTITGQNFSPGGSSNHAFIGDAINNLCEVTSATETEIKCEVPKMHTDYTSGQVLNVVVTGRYTEESLCEGTCTFSYDAAQTTNILVPEDL